MIRLVLSAAYLFLFSGIGFSFHHFKESSSLEKIILAIFISMSINVALGFILGGNANLMHLIGGYTFENIFLANGIIGFIGIAIYLVNRNVRPR